MKIETLDEWKVRTKKEPRKVTITDEHYMHPYRGPYIDYTAN